MVSGERVRMVIPPLRIETLNPFPKETTMAEQIITRFDDRPMSDQIQILRQEVMGLRIGLQMAQQSSGDVAQRHFRLAEVFASHQHGESNEVLVPAQRLTGGGPMTVMGPATMREDPLR
jgi:hypothetical protein